MNYLRWRINYVRRTGSIADKPNRFGSRESSSRRSSGRKQFEASNSSTFLVSKSGRSSKNKSGIMQTMSTLYQQNNKRIPIYAKGMGPSSAWDTVALDLFGPLPTGKHVLVVQDLLTRYPAAKIVPSTSSSKVIPALHDIYIDYGYPTTHLTDNGPPLNSAEFTSFSKNSDIHQQTIYPDHPQANPAEHIMKPPGKALKAVHLECT